MNESGTNGRRWLVSGRVQGVGFRWFVLHAAREIGLSGTVRNLADGRVEVLASGAAGALDKFEEQLTRGPASARVDTIQTAPASVPRAAEGFCVKH